MMDNKTLPYEGIWLKAQSFRLHKQHEAVQIDYLTRMINTPHPDHPERSYYVREVIADALFTVSELEDHHPAEYYDKHRTSLSPYELRKLFSSLSDDMLGKMDGMLKNFARQIISDVKSGKIDIEADDPFEGAGGEETYTNDHIKMYQNRYNKR